MNKLTAKCEKLQCLPNSERVILDSSKNNAVAAKFVSRAFTIEAKKKKMTSVRHFALYLTFIKFSRLFRCH